MGERDSSTGNKQSRTGQEEKHTNTSPQSPQTSEQKKTTGNSRGSWWEVGEDKTTVLKTQVVPTDNLTKRADRQRGELQGVEINVVRGNSWG